MELAIVLVVLLPLLYAIVDLGHMGALAIRVQNAARAGAQYGAISKTNATDSAAVTTVTKNSVPSLSSVMTVTVTSYCACSNAPMVDDNTCTASCTATRLMYSSVQVSVPNTPILPYALFINSLPATLSGKAIMQIGL